MLTEFPQASSGSSSAVFVSSSSSAGFSSSKPNCFCLFVCFFVLFVCLIVCTLYSSIGRDVFNTAGKWFRHLPDPNHAQEVQELSEPELHGEAGLQGDEETVSHFCRAKEKRKHQGTVTVVLGCGNDRSSLQQGFDQLQSLVVSASAYPSGKVSKAVILEKSKPFPINAHPPWVDE